MKEIIAILTQMKSLANEIEDAEAARLLIPACGEKFGYTIGEIAEMTANANDNINDLIRQYRALSKEQFQLLRAFEIRDAKPLPPVERTNVPLGCTGGVGFAPNHDYHSIFPRY